MKKLLLVLALFSGLSAGAQTYQWARRIGSPVVVSSVYNVIRSSTTDAAGNVYVTGSFYGTNVDFNPNGAPLTLSSSWDNVFFAKYSATGSCLWAKAILGPGGGGGECIRIGPGGDIFITGSFGGSNVDFDPGPATATLSAASTAVSNIFIARYDANGNYVWAKGMGGTGKDWSKCLSLDAGGNVYITGDFTSNAADLDPGPGVANLSAVGSEDIFFAKYDGAGNYLWAKSIGSGGSDISHAISLDAGGNVYITGNFSGGATDFDPGPGTATLSGTAIFFAKYDANGNYAWARAIQAAGTGKSVHADPAGIYLCGSFSGTANVDFDPGPSTATLNAGSSGTLPAMFLGRYDQNGNYLWAKAVEKAAAWSMAISSQDKLYVIGNFAAGGGPVDFDPGPGTATLVGAGGIGSGDVFFAKYDGTGNYVWAKALYKPKPSNHYGYAISVDASENVFIGGAFNGARLDFDTGPGTDTLSSVGYYSMYLAKYGYCSQLVNNTRHICTGQSYVVNGNSYTSSGTYTDTLYTSFGCDSVVVTQLTVSGVPPAVAIGSSSVLCTGSGNTLTASGAATYTWSTGAQGPVIAVTPTLVMQYVVAGTGTNGCIVSDTIDVIPSPTLGILTKPAVCEGEQMTVTASGASTYTWSTGANTSSYSAIVYATTAYTVMGTVAGTPCIARRTFTVHAIPCLGVNSNYSGATVSVYPNPATTELYYTLNVNRIHRYAVINSNGVPIEEGEQSGSKVRLDVSNYAPGIYNLNITLGKTLLSKKFLVKKSE